MHDLHTTQCVDHLTPLDDSQRIFMLELAMDAVTSQMVEPGRMVEATDAELKRFQTQSRIIASQIRSYEKLQALKKNLEKQQDAEHISSAVGAASQTTPTPENQASDIAAAPPPLNSDTPTAPKNRAERRRRDRIARKALKRGEKKPTPSIMNGICTGQNGSNVKIPPESGLEMMLAE